MTMILFSRRNRAMILNYGAMVVLCVGLAGCNNATDPAGASLDESIAAPPSALSYSSSPAQMMALTTSAPTQPIAALPEEAGAIASVRSHAYVNGFRQDILLKNNAVHAVPNSLTILARTSRQATLDEATPLFKPSEPTVRAELGKQFPHIGMQVVERPSSNAYGPYGLALGRGTGTVHCLYMWQWIDENRLPQDSGVSGPVSVRVRLCQANTTFDAMAALIDHLTIGHDATTRYALASNDGAGIVAGPTEADPAKPAPRRHVRRLAQHIKHVAVAQSDPDRNEPRLVEPQPSAASPAVVTPLSTDLPPQAYLGPGAGKKK